jgi:hypothetical protein
MAFPLFPSYFLFNRGNVKNATITINTAPVAYIAQGLTMGDSTTIV